MGRPKGKKYQIKCDICHKEFKVNYFGKFVRPRKYCSRKCFFKKNRGKNHYNWKDVKLDKDGYVLINMPDHPNCNPNGYVREHRIVMEKYIGRYLDRKEVVHHINGIKNDNRIENLELFTSNSKHMKHEYNNGKLIGMNGPWRNDGI